MTNSQVKFLKHKEYDCNYGNFTYYKVLSPLPIMNTGLISHLKVNIFLELFDINTYFVELSPIFAMAYSLITGATSFVGTSE